MTKHPGWKNTQAEKASQTRKSVQAENVHSLKIKNILRRKAG